MLDRPLEHIGQHGISPAKRHQRGFGEKPAHLRQDRVPAVKRRQAAHAASPAKQHMVGCRGMVINEHIAELLGRLAMTVPGGEFFRRIAELVEMVHLLASDMLDG